MDTVIKLKKRFGQNIKELRLFNKWTQEQLAEKVACDRQTISATECGRSFPSIEIIDSLSKVFDVDASVLFKEKISVITKKHIDYSDKIRQLLPSFSEQKLEEIYKMLLIMEE